MSKNSSNKWTAMREYPQEKCMLMRDSYARDYYNCKKVHLNQVLYLNMNMIEYCCSDESFVLICW